MRERAIMNKLRLTLIACVSTLAFAGTASAQNIFQMERTDGYVYTSGFVGAVFPDDIANIDLDTDITYGGAIGGKLPFKSFGFIHTRIEAEVSYFETDASSSDPAFAFVGGTSLDNLFIYGNSYADFIWKENQAAIPYFGGGLGIAISDAPGVSSTTNFSTHNSIGLTVPINQIDLYAEGRYFTIYNDGPNLDGINLTVGLRYKF